MIWVLLPVEADLKSGFAATLQSVNAGSVDDAFAAGAGAAFIEIDATLLTVRMLMSMSGMERAFRTGLCRQSVLTCPFMRTLG